MRAWPSLLLALLLLAACQRRASGPLPHRGYLWQREWTAAVRAALPEAAANLQGVVLFGAEIQPAGAQPSIQRANIDWKAVRASPAAYALALRVAPHPGPFRVDDALGSALMAEAKRLLTSAREAGVTPTELQLDFDCAQGKLAGYRTWVKALREAIHPTRLIITALPAWLAEPQFAPLVQAADGFVLQVHSVPLGAGASARLCEPGPARRWVEQAAKAGVPFAVALPTYRCVAGYAPDGRLLGVAMDGPQPSWPPSTRTLEVSASAPALAGLVQAWQADRPALLHEILWYRVPVPSDQRNWRWATLRSVMAGRAPMAKWEVRRTGDNPADFSLYNAGETDEPLAGLTVAVQGDAPPLAGDAVRGWELQLREQGATFTPSGLFGLRLPPGAARPMGWLRYGKPPISWQISVDGPAAASR